MFLLGHMGSLGVVSWKNIPSMGISGNTHFTKLCSTICLVAKTYQGLSTSSRTNQQDRIAFSILRTSFDKIQQLSGDKYG